MSDTLLIPPVQTPSSSNTPYTAVYTFRAVDTSAGTTSVKPVGYISSGAQVKYTGSYPATLPPIQPVANTLVLSATAAPTLVNAAERDATITVTAANSGAATTIDDFAATLPAGAAYVGGSSRYGGTPIGDPAVSGQTLTWAQLFAIHASSSSTFTFQVRYPAVDGSHTTSLVAHVGSAQIDTTLSTVDDAPATASVTVDATAPAAAIASKPANPSASKLAAFGFTSDAAAASFQCSLDGGAWSGCTSPRTYTGLEDGEHTFAVRATDPAGNVGPSAAYTWTVAAPSDTTPPTVSFVSAPDSETSETTGSFSFTADEDVVFQCRLDGGAWVECASPSTYTGLSSGEHLFEVKAVDGAGNESSIAEHSWTVTVASDTTPPTVTIESGPPATTTAASATIAFSADEPSTFECSLDGGAWAHCTSPASYSGLASGGHMFRVRATDGAGNTSGEATLTWTVTPAPDPTAPAVTIDGGPPATTTATAAAFSFSSDEAETFECSLDGGPWEPCASPAAYDGLAPGAHTFQVRGVDGSGGAGVPASHAWTVLLPASPPQPAAESGGGDGGGPRIVLSAAAAQNLVLVGQRANLTVVVENLGSAAAANVVVRVELPANVDRADVPPRCTLDGRTLTCTLDALDAGSEHEIVISFRARKVGRIVSRAAVASSGSPDDVEVEQQATRCTIIGTEDDDVLIGTPGRDVICGLGGDDVLHGLGGDDVLIGGDGNDRLYGGPGNDFVAGGAGDDLLDGGAGDDVLRGRDGADRLYGRGGSDKLYGDAGDDELHGGSGDDFLFGGTGDDRLDGGPGRDWLNGGDGRDLAGDRGTALGFHQIERRVRGRR